MKIIIPVHAYPPARLGGTELYAQAYARALVRAGHDVAVFAAEKDVSRADLSMHVSAQDGVRVARVTNNLYLKDFGETFDRPAVEAHFEDFLQKEKPDVVHVMHAADLTAAIPRAAARAGAPVGYTLHDYWFSCPRWGQRYHPDGKICIDVDRDVCAACVPRIPWRQPRGASSVGKLLAGLKSTVGIDLSDLAKRTLRSVRSARPAAPSADELRGYRAGLDARDRFLRDECIPHVDLFLAPTEFLAREMIQFGLPAGRVRTSRLGIDADDLRSLPRRRGDRVRVAFHGSMMRSKAPHLLLEAWSKLPSATRARATLALRGARRDPFYGAELDAAAKAAGAVIEPEFTRADLAERLTRTDLLVVPSVWWENSPLAILEALAARVPLLVSDLGGMAELVVEGAGGYRFRPGDSDDLARRLRELIDAPELLDRCVANPVRVRSVADDAAELPTLILQARARRTR